jgi:hypothetical protein
MTTLKSNNITQCINRLVTAPFVLLALVTTAGLSNLSANENDSSFNFFTATFENDLFVGEDNGYTNGFGLTFATGPFDEFTQDNTPSWLHRVIEPIYINTLPDKQRGIAHMFFQRMQTPDDIEQRELINDDLPYAGLLAWQGIFYAWDDHVADQLSLYIGVVGPASYAEKTQNIVHDVLGSDNPKGWDNQIGNEAVFKVEADRVWNIYRTDSDLQYDVIGFSGAALGTMDSHIKSGIAIRLGKNLDTSFPTFSLQTDRQVNPLAMTDAADFYLFAGVQLKYVFNDIMINGNTFKNSHSVPIKNTLNQFSFGGVWSINSIAIVFQFSTLSSRTTILDAREKFGALSITYQY